MFFPLSRLRFGFACLLLFSAALAVASTPTIGYSTYLGKSAYDELSAMRVDSAGNVYLAGGTSSPDFPVTAGAFMTSCPSNPCSSGFIAKLDPTGSKLLYSTFFPAGVNGMAVDASGAVYLTGNIGTGFSTTPGALNTSTSDLYVAKLNPSGSALEYAAHFGSSAHDFPTGIADDADGNAYITGWSYGTDYPVTPGAFQTPQLGAFVTKLNSTGSALVYSARFGGSDTANNGQLGTRLWAISVDSGGEAYVAGQTDSKLFPTTSNAYRRTSAGGADAVLFRLNAAGSALVYSTYFGGAGSGVPCCEPEGAYALAINASGGAYITGSEKNNSTVPFPTTAGAFQKTFLPNSDTTTFVAHFDTNASGTSSLVYSTLLGGKTQSGGLDRGIAIDSAGNAYVSGQLADTVFPTTPTALTSCEPTTNGLDFVVTALGPKGDHLLFSTIIGGKQNDLPQGSGIDASGNLYVAGTTWSLNYPTTTGALQTASGGPPDAFISKFNRASFTTLAPRAVVCTPQDNAGVSSPFPVAGGLQSGYPSRFISIDLDGVSVYQLNRLNIIKKNISASSGTHQLTVRAETASGVTVTKTVTIRVK